MTVQFVPKLSQDNVTLLLKSLLTLKCLLEVSFLYSFRQSTAPSVVGSLNEKDEKSKKAKQPIVIWPEWTEQDINQEKWVSQLKAN